MVTNVNIPDDAEGRKLYTRMLELYKKDIQLRAKYETRKWAEHELNVAKEQRMAAKANGSK